MRATGSSFPGKLDKDDGIENMTVKKTAINAMLLTQQKR
jgi:hypothetical protein